MYKDLLMMLFSSIVSLRNLWSVDYPIYLHLNSFLFKKKHKNNLQYKCYQTILKGHCKTP